MNTKDKPFFTRFLESQDFPSVKTNVKAGSGNVTLKYPSDSDENVTTKYPSDSDEVEK